jgi:N utilization substance protein B
MRLSRREQRLRRRARARALQALYAWDVVGRDDLVATAQRVWEDLGLGAEERAIAEPLVAEAARSLSEIDSTLADATANWRLGRLGAVERSVLRLALAELRLGNTPPRVVIQEAVRLAERFGTLESARFVNGVLDAIAHRMGKV